MTIESRSRPIIAIQTLVTWLLALIWLLPLLYAVWAAIHPRAYEVRLALFAPLTFDNFVRAWDGAPFTRYFFNTFRLVILIPVCQFVFCSLAAYSFVCFPFRGSKIIFMFVLLQMLIMPEVLMVENYHTINRLGLLDTTVAIALPYMATGFGIFLFRQAFKSIPKEIEDAARIDGAGVIRILVHVYVPLSKLTYLTYGLVSVCYQWNNFLWPLVVTNTAKSRPITVGLKVFTSIEQGVDWSLLMAATLISVAPLLIAFLVFQRRFVQSYMRAGIR